MASPFDERYPNLAAWTRHGWIEVGCDDFNRSFVRVLDLGGLVWEGTEEYETVEAALVEAEAAAARWFEENGRVP